MRADIAIGVRLAVGRVRGSRQAVARFVLTALAIGVCVAVLLFGVAVIGAIGTSSVPGAARVPVLAERSGVEPLHLAESFQVYDGTPISGRHVREGGRPTPVPPGIPAVPRPGEVFVSPALAVLLDTDAALAARFSATRVGVIEGAGLLAADELYFYRGVDRFEDGEPTARVYGFGGPAGDGASPGQLILVIAAGGVLLVPLLMFVSCVGRLGGQERDRQLATLRLLGARAAQVRRIAVTESFAGAAVGAAVGVAIFYVGHSRLANLWSGARLFHIADALPPWPTFVVVPAVVVASATGAALVGMRNVLVEPLGVARRGGTSWRRLWWRLIPVGLSVVFLAPVVLDRAGDSGTTTVLASCGMVSMLAAVPVLLPWLVERVVGVLRGGPPSWQLAVRRLQVDSGTPSRVVGGIAVVLAAAIGARVLITSIEGLVAASEGARFRVQWFTIFRGGIYLLSAFTLLVAGASLLVLIAHQLTERRRAVAALAASGIPWGVIGRSLLWQNVVPIGLGVLAADITGFGLAAVTLRALRAPLVLDWSFVAVVNSIAVLVIGLVTLLAIPVLRVLARADGLRSE
ncbi:FtsX-like permease family protein [Actinosynnema sp. NPDC047251]|uniref:FtsX-like permease family protein n=1 Tax=Saccharothrix espanaensis TaxID=103731 RepID=UPI00059C22C0|nr:FtsX-like permease family protein [Saccharothrix espanaensis]